VLGEALTLFVALGAAGARSRWPAIVGSELVYESAPVPCAHASTIAEARDGLVAAWFGGTREGHPDVGIWISRQEGGRWLPPVEVANGAQPDGTRHPCWNPVLFQPADGPLLLFYKVGPSPRAWWALVRISADGGRTWSAAAKLPDGILGPIRAKPVERPGGGELLAGSSTEHEGWLAYLERFRSSAGWTLEALSSARSWSRGAALNDPKEFAAIQPAILLHSPTRWQLLCRSQQGVVTEAWTEDGGLTWSRMRATSLPNPSAGIDALRLADGRLLLAYNPTASGREKLGIAVSVEGQSWQPVVTLEDAPGEYSYPAMIQTRDGLVHVTYTWKRQRIKHVVVDPGPARHD
jgi:predicted neuraminidase